jgi:ABC-2 type transport system ATP-binding protein
VNKDGIMTDEDPKDPTPEAKAEAEPEAEPEAKAEAKAEPDAKAEAKPDADAKAKPDADAKAKAKPKAKAKARVEVSGKDDPSEHGPYAGKRPVTISVEEISKFYGQFAALSQVTFSVRKGTVAAFLGPNGAGKSTTMRILTGFLAPTRGRASVLGLDPTHPEQRRQLAQKLGYLPESGPLYRDMTPYESLGFFADVRSLDRPTRRIDAVVERCAIGSVLHKPIYKLSKGYRQRVGMAQALLHDPEVLILDEPTSGLDPLQIREVRELIRELGREKTLLLSTHILQEVEAVADEVVVISEGKIVFTGTKAELTKDATVEARFYELAAKHETKKEVA